MDSDLRIDLPQGRFLIDRDRVADLDMDLAEVGSPAQRFSVGQLHHRFDLDGTAYRVIPMVERAGRSDADALLDLKLRRRTAHWFPFPPWRGWRRRWHLEC